MRPSSFVSPRVEAAGAVVAAKERLGTEAPGDAAGVRDADERPQQGSIFSRRRNESFRSRAASEIVVMEEFPQEGERFRWFVRLPPVERAPPVTRSVVT
ncbi:MAG: hypothetical protein HY900_29400 [Deltaproteobacteria bacterium]|nr:hypothetical protein [Deltaproteobacteria bacterium]